VKPRVWHIVTGEYPPRPGGIADYAGRLVAALRARGEEVQVWTPPFGLAGLRAIGRGVDSSRSSGARPILLVQYAPNAFGMRGANVPFCAWLLVRAWRRDDDIRVMFHEPFFYFARQPLRRNLLALAHRIMAALLLASSRIAYVSTSSWEKLLSRYAPARRAFVCLPIPATVHPPASDHDEAKASYHNEAEASYPESRKARPLVVGHFGSYPDDVALELERVIGAMLPEIPDATVLLIGRNSERFKQRHSEAYPEHAGRVAATGELAASEIGHQLRACDFVVQPYPDGATTRRTSLMASLACGVPTVTTIGVWSEPVWRAAREAIELAPAGDVASIVDRCKRLANDPARREALGVAGRDFYERNFAIQRTLRTLCGADDTDPSVLIGVHAHPATGETARRQRDALAAIAALDGIRRVNLQFASPDAPPIEVDGFETLRALESDSNQVTGRSGRRKPIASEMFDVLARRALEEGCAYFAYVNSDTVLSQGALERIGAGGADAYLLARTDIGNGRPSGILLSGMDGFAINACWWVSNRWRFRPYPIGEPVWDCVYSAKLACHGRASFVYSLGALTHERHEPAWLSSPFAQYVQYLSALDALYFSLWCRYHDRLTRGVDAGRELDCAAAIAAGTFVWRPSAFARAVQASRRVKGWVRYVASESTA